MFGATLNPLVQHDPAAVVLFMGQGIALDNVPLDNGPGGAVQIRIFRQFPSRLFPVVLPEHLEHIGAGDFQVVFQEFDPVNAHQSPQGVVLPMPAPGSRVPVHIGQFLPEDLCQESPLPGTGFGCLTTFDTITRLFP